jgi:2-polyprenyl-3-methyl-5-hydroxy-6-metoxy-1,4-benzoquinol methylase
MQQSVSNSRTAEPQKPALVFRVLRALWRLVIDPPFRNVLWLWIWRPRAAFQPVNDTWPDRYPYIFSFVRNEVGIDRAVNILSYGCSTGDEVFTLRDYLPRAAIKGIDINAGNIAACWRRLRRAPDPGVSFATASSTVDEPGNCYDVIFCMAVLRHERLSLPGVTRCDHLLRFEDFAGAVADFHRCLKPGGLLVIRHSNFRLCDAPIGTEFETILSDPVPSEKTPIFGPDNRLLSGVDYPDAVFRKKR